MDNLVYTDDTCYQLLIEARKALMINKPQDRSELARRYQVTVTELEKVIAYFNLYVVERDFWPHNER